MEQLHAAATITLDSPPIHCPTCITLSSDIPLASADSLSGAGGGGNTHASCGADSRHARFAVTERRME